MSFVGRIADAMPVESLFLEEVPGPSGLPLLAREAMLQPLCIGGSLLLALRHRLPRPP
jgi:hypothetical protein